MSLLISILQIISAALLTGLSEAAAGKSCSTNLTSPESIGEPINALLQFAPPLAGMATENTSMEEEVGLADLHDHIISLSVLDSRQRLVAYDPGDGHFVFWMIALANYGLVLGCVVIAWRAVHRRVQEKNETVKWVKVDDQWVPRAWEKKWVKESLAENVRASAYAFFYLTCGLMVYNTYFLIIRPTCLARDDNLILRWITKFGVLAILLGFNIECMQRPKEILYWIVLCFYFMYIPAISLPPFRYSCLELEQKCFGSTDRFVSEAVQHIDCTLQGHTATQICMTWLLALPWIIARLRTMHFVWVWIFGIYLPWSFLYRHYAGEENFFSISDVMTRVALLCCTLTAAIFKKYYLHTSQHVRFMHEMRRRQCTARMFSILEYMMPEHAILPLLTKTGAGCFVETCSRVSIMFILIEDFDKLTHQLLPKELLQYLNEQFTQIDKIVSEHGVTKIETVGEEYVCCVGVTPKDKEKQDEEHGANDHGKILKRIFRAADKILQLQTKEVQFKLGVHTGPVVAGVIGHKLPRYRLFGDTINTSARMMQKGLPGELQFGEETYKCLPEKFANQCKYRGEVEMKGKGMVKTYLFGKKEEKSQASGTDVLKRASTYDVSQKPTQGVVSRKSTTFFEDDEEPPEIKKARVALTTELFRCIPQEFEQGPAAKAKRELIHAPTRKHMLGRASSLPSLNEGESGTESLETIASDRRGSETSVTETHPTHEAGEEDMEDKLKGVEQDVMADEQSASVQWHLNRLQFWNKGFKPEMEQDWLKEFHEQQTMKNLSQRLGKQAMCLLMLSMVEAPYLFVIQKDKHYNELDQPAFRLPVFLYCRGTALLILLSWWMAADYRDLMRSNPGRIQWYMVISYVAVAILFLMSYDSLTLIDDDSKSGDQQPRHKWDDKAPFDQIFALSFSLVYFLIIRECKVRFSLSLVFVLLAALMMYHPGFGKIGAIFYSNMGKLLFLANAIMSASASYIDEQKSREGFKAKRAVEVTQTRIESILNTLMPPLVVEQLRKAKPSDPPPSHKYRHATIAQSDLCGFTAISSTRTPAEVVEFIGEIFGLFDMLTDKHEVYKVETVGDAYIAGQADEPLTIKNSPVSVVRFAMDMVVEVKKWSDEKGLKVNCRVGVHHGECVGGIVGADMQRYHLFGELMTVIEVLESTAPEGMVQMSKACKEEVEREIREEGTPRKENLKFEIRTEPHLTTSKGEVHEYSECGGTTYVVQPCGVRFS